MNVEIGTEAPIFLFWEYLFQIFGILSLQCGRESNQGPTLRQSANHLATPNPSIILPSRHGPYPLLLVLNFSSSFTLQTQRIPKNRLCSKSITTWNSELPFLCLKIKITCCRFRILCDWFIYPFKIQRKTKSIHLHKQRVRYTWNDS